ncbi:MAG TPA: SigB/SigF/SigG family RNA polymerase sigma factor [Thermoleophilaceae bacterium]|nr:SigB/SigF/SigG family RNA polymerase sigma factor [Thermoleophilaceae bacterium]
MPLSSALVSPPNSTQPATDRLVAKRAEQVLFRRYQRDGDLHARRDLVERYLPLARSLARRYDGRGESLDDLVQVASVGLVKAIDRFDADRDLSFSSYAVPTILGELRRYFRDSGWAVHVPRQMQESALKVNTAIERLSSELGHSPSPQLIAAELGLSVEEVLEAMAANSAYDTTSLDTPFGSGDGERRTIAESFGETDARFDLIDGRVSVGPALKALPERERLILHLRFVEDRTQSEIAERIGVSQMHVSRLIRRALEQVRLGAGPAA